MPDGQESKMSETILTPLADVASKALIEVIKRQKCVTIEYKSKHCKDCRDKLLWSVISNAATEIRYIVPPDMRDWLPENH